MLLEHEFVVPVPVHEAWNVLLDVERIAPCMPGATVEGFDGETVTGKVKVKVGPIQVSYSGRARFVERDLAARRIVIEATGQETRGSGTASATIEARLVDEGGTSTRVTVSTDLAITGKPAQFGRGVMADVGNRLLGQFATCLAEKIVGAEHEEAEEGAGAAPAAAPTAPGGGQVPAAGGEAEAAGGAEAAGEAAQPAGAAGEVAPGAGSAADTSRPAAPAGRPATPLQPVQEAEPINLVGAAWWPVLKRVAPFLVGLGLGVVLCRVVSGRRSPRSGRRPGRGWISSARRR